MENSAVRICSFNKTGRVVSTKDNCKEFRVLPIIFLYEKLFSIIHIELSSLKFAIVRKLGVIKKII